MKNLLIFTAIFLFILWAVIFIGFHAGGVVHFLLVMVLVCIMLIRAGEKRKLGDHTV